MSEVSQSVIENKEQQRKHQTQEECKVNYLSTKQNTRLLNLVGKGCMVKCNFNNIPVSALWDTGAQANLINDDW